MFLKKFLIRDLGVSIRYFVHLSRLNGVKRLVFFVERVGNRRNFHLRVLLSYL